MKNILIQIKNTILILLGTLFLTITILMIKQSTQGTVIFGILTFVCFFFGKDLILNEVLKIEDIITRKNKLKNEINELEIQKNNTLSLIEKSSRSIEDLYKELESMNKKKKDLDIQIKNRESFFVETELKYIDTLSGLEFENYCCDLLKKLGYSAVVTKPTQDSGGDIIAGKDGLNYIIQCKHYSDSVGNKAIQEVYAAKGIYKCDKAIVLTNNYFTNQATKEATMLEVVLWDRAFLQLALSSGYHFSIQHLDFSTNDI